VKPRNALLDIAPLVRRQLPIDTVAMARFLIGKALVHDAPDGTCAGRIVETEAYTPDDPASHAFRGLTKRNASMFLERGIAYVYLIYGTSLCLNVVSGRAGLGAAVLIRALEPLAGIDVMEARRPGASLRDLARGPGRLTAALGIVHADDGVDLCGGRHLWLGSLRASPALIGASVRIGLTKAAGKVLRFYERDSTFVSGPRRLSV